MPLAVDAAARSVLARELTGFEPGAVPHADFVLPASIEVPLIVKVEDSLLRPPQFVAGPSRHHRIVEGRCAPAYVEAWLAPLGAYTVLGVPLSEVAGGMHELGDLVGVAAERLGSAIREAPTWEGRQQAMNAFLRDRLDQGPRPSPEVLQAWHLLVGSRGGLRVSTMAEQVGWSHKHLIAKFKEQIGVTPRTAARLLRFADVWRQLQERGDWARVAADAGYADQSHLVREFRQFAGTTPTALLTS